MLGSDRNEKANVGLSPSVDTRFNEGKTKELHTRQVRGTPRNILYAWKESQKH